jgi:hypothetical protein
LINFIQRQGGINACVARFSRCLGDGPQGEETAARSGR